MPLEIYSFTLSSHKKLEIIISGTRNQMDGILQERKGWGCLQPPHLHEADVFYWLKKRFNSFIIKWWLGAESNRRHKDFQSSALPTELPSLPQANIQLIASTVGKVK
jgi:hypothetical protein